MDTANNHHGGTESSLGEYLKFVAVLVAIVVTSMALSFFVGNDGLQDWMRWFMGVFFMVFAAFKFAGYRMFASMFAGYDVIARRFKLYGYLYPFIELALGLVYIFDLLGVYRDVFTALVMFISAIGVYQEIKKRSGIHCACLGNIIKLPLSTTSLVENLSMGIMAAVMIVAA